MASKSSGVEQKRHDGDNQVMVLIDSRASGNYFDDQLILQPKHRLLDHVDLTVPRKILTAGGSLLDRTTGGLLQGYITAEYGYPPIFRVGILIMSGIGSNLYSVKTTASKGIASIFNVENLN